MNKVNICDTQTFVNLKTGVATWLAALTALLRDLGMDRLVAVHGIALGQIAKHHQPLRHDRCSKRLGAHMCLHTRPVLVLYFFDRLSEQSRGMPSKLRCVISRD